MTRKYTNRIILHCSATPNDREITASDLRRWHVNSKGWDDIGYHYVIRRDGILEPGRSVMSIGAHVKGHNHDSIGICVVGMDEFTEPQWRGLFFLLNQLRESFSLSYRDVYCHYEFTNKSCPNFDAVQIRSTLKELWDVF